AVVRPGVVDRVVALEVEGAARKVVQDGPAGQGEGAGAAGQGHGAGVIDLPAVDGLRRGDVERAGVDELAAAGRAVEVAADPGGRAGCGQVARPGDGAAVVEDQVLHAQRGVDVQRPAEHAQVRQGGGAGGGQRVERGHAHHAGAGRGGTRLERVAAAGD